MTRLRSNRGETGRGDKFRCAAFLQPIDLSSRAGRQRCLSPRPTSFHHFFQTQQTHSTIPSSYATNSAPASNLANNNNNNGRFELAQPMYQQQQQQVTVCSPSSAPIINTMTSLIEDDLRSLSSGSSSGYASNDLDSCQPQHSSSGGLVNSCVGSGQFFASDSFLPSIEDFNFGQPLQNSHVAAAGGWGADFWPPSHSLIHNQFDQFAL